MARLTDDGVTPGFYQAEPQHGAVGGPRLRGRKSGREAPRDHQRQPAWEDTLQRHDMLPKHDNQVGSNTAFNPNQGQLFDTQRVAPRDTRSDRDIAASLGASTGEIAVKGDTSKVGLAAQPGFLPGLNNKQKVKALVNTAQARYETGAQRGPGVTSEMMAARAAVGGANAPWYQGVNARGQHDSSIPGDAGRKVQESAARSGTTFSQQARAVAITSPQMAWKNDGSSHLEVGAPGRFPNIEVAESAIRGHRDVIDGLPAMKEKAQNEYVGSLSRDNQAVGPFPVQTITSQKAPNFDASLNLSHKDPAVQRIAAQSYTVDRHDAAVVGIDGDKGLGRRGVYEVAAMTGRRQALKNRQLPPNEQASEWEAHRNNKGLSDGNQLIEGGRNGTPMQVNPKAVSRTPTTRASRRGFGSNPAADGLEF